MSYLNIVQLIIFYEADVFVGKYWFERFEKSGETTFKFATAAEYNAARTNIKSSEEWLFHKKNYISRCNGGKLLPTNRNVFVIESEPFVLNHDTSTVVHVMVGKIIYFCFTLKHFNSKIFKLWHVIYKIMQHKANFESKT